MYDSKVILMAIDIGGASENGITIMNEKEQILYTEAFPYVKKFGKGFHRRSISHHIKELVLQYKVTRIIVERVKLFRGSNISKLSNITSHWGICVGILDSVQGLCDVYDVEVRTWKSQVLNNISKDKEFSINYVKLMYNMDMKEHQADSVCIAIYGIRNWMRMDKKQNISKE